MDGVVGREGNTLMSFIRTLALGLGAVSIAAVHGGTLYAAARAAEPWPRVVELKEGWQVQCGCGLSADGETVSKPQFKSADWLPASVPSTVLAVQLAAGKIPDPYYGDNLRKLPGVDYPIGENFSN